MNIKYNTIENFRERWVAKSKNNRIKTLSKEQLLHDCEVVSDNGITYAALILFGKNSALKKYISQAEIIFDCC
jgi:ATP-dependent DNA helicase RecG